MAAILQISACFLLLLWPLSTETCSSTKEQCENETCSSTKEQWENDLYLASLNGELQKVKKALEYINPNVLHDEYYSTPLMAAAEKGHASVVQYLIDHGADMEEIRPITGNTALHLAAYHNKTNVARMLLVAGSDVNVRNKGAFTPLMVAAEKGHVSVVQALIDHGAYIEETRPSTGSTALHIAAYYNQANIVPKLLLANADVNVRNKHGHTPLMWATYKGHFSVVQALLDSCNIVVDLAGPREWTALHYAAHSDQIAIAQLLLNNGADKTKHTENGMTPAGIAEQENNQSVKRVIENN